MEFFFPWSLWKRCAAAAFVGSGSGHHGGMLDGIVESRNLGLLFPFPFSLFLFFLLRKHRVNACNTRTGPRIHVRSRVRQLTHCSLTWSTTAIKKWFERTIVITTRSPRDTSLLLTDFHVLRRDAISLHKAESTSNVSTLPIPAVPSDLPTPTSDSPPSTMFRSATIRVRITRALDARTPPAAKGQRHESHLPTRQHQPRPHHIPSPTLKAGSQNPHTTKHACESNTEVSRRVKFRQTGYARPARDRQDDTHRTTPPAARKTRLANAGSRCECMHESLCRPVPAPCVAFQPPSAVRKVD